MANIATMLQSSNPTSLLLVSASDLAEFGRSLIAEAIENAKTIAPAKDDEEYMTAREVEMTYHISDTTLWRWGKSGYLVPVKVGGINRYRKTDVEQVMKGGKQ